MSVYDDDRQRDDPNELNWLDEMDELEDPLEDAYGYTRSDLLFGGNW